MIYVPTRHMQNGITSYFTKQVLIQSLGDIETVLINNFKHAADYSESCFLRLQETAVKKTLLLLVLLFHYHKKTFFYFYFFLVRENQSSQAVIYCNNFLFSTRFAYLIMMTKHRSVYWVDEKFVLLFYVSKLNKIELLATP